jgi:CheY-like chemotaxis protein
MSSIGMGTPKRILLVEDNDDARELFAMTLRHAGYDVAEARDGREAIMRVGGIRPMVVVTDVAMPELDGVTLAKLLASNPETSDIPVIAITGQKEQIDVTPFYCVVAKPCAPDTLLGMVALSIESARWTRRTSAQEELLGDELELPLEAGFGASNS